VGTQGWGCAATSTCGKGFMGDRVHTGGGIYHVGEGMGRGRAERD
jgi:hypothetical protein